MLYNVEKEDEKDKYYQDIYRLINGKKCIVFANSKKLVEQTAYHLKKINKDFGGKDKDSDSRDNRQGGGRRDNNRRGGMDIPAPEKPLEKNRDNNRHNQNQQAKWLQEFKLM